MPALSFAAISGVYTNDATNITDISAKLNGGGNTGGGNDFGYFRYSTVPSNPPVFCNDIYGIAMKSTNAINVNGSIGFSMDATNLESNTQYAYCAIISNSALNPTDIKYGNVKTFWTNPCATCDQTTINTTNALVASGTSAYLNGNYNSTVAVKTYFEYRKLAEPPANGGRPTPLPWIQVGMQNKNPQTSGNISTQVSGLLANTTYEYRAAGDSGTSTNPILIYGAILEFTTHDNGTVGPNNNQNGNGGTVQPNGPVTYNNYANLPESPSLTPDDVVHYKEGIETVFIRQIVGNTTFAKAYGYKDGMNLQSFAYGLAHTFAQLFGYVNGGVHEIRVITPDVAAYQFGVKDGKLVVFEYYNGHHTGTSTFTMNLKNAFGYEYYFNRKLK